MQNAQKRSRSKSTTTKKKASPPETPKDAPSTKPTSKPGATRETATRFLRHEKKIGASTEYVASMLPAHDEWTVVRWCEELERIEKLAPASFDAPSDPNSRRLIAFDDAALATVGTHHGEYILKAVIGEHSYEEGETRPDAVAYDLERLARLVWTVEHHESCKPGLNALLEPLLHVCADAMKTAAARLRIAAGVDRLLVGARNDALEHLKIAQQGVEVQS